MRSIESFKINILCVLALLASTTVVSAQTTIDNLEIQKTESYTLQAGTTVKNLIIHADKYSCGQLKIESGIVKIDKMTYTFTITPSEWTVISFPSDIVDVTSATSSNLTSLGLTLNGTGTKKTLIKRYDTQARAIGNEPWTLLTTGALKANTGYLFAIVTGGTTPTDIQFYFDNVNLDKAKQANQILVDVDMAGKIAQNDYPITIQPTNVKGNALNVTIHNAPASGGAIDYQKALELANIYFTEDKGGIRISLPNSESCKVMIMDKNMKKVIKAVDYVSPGVIPVTGIKKNAYKVYLEYGNGKDVKDLTIK